LKDFAREYRFVVRSNNDMRERRERRRAAGDVAFLEREGPETRSRKSGNERR
jgi:hypothetical protein